jgi:hypothetical protein
VNILSSQTLHQQEGKARVTLIAEPASPARPASQSEHHQHFPRHSGGCNARR